MAQCPREYVYVYDMVVRTSLAVSLKQTNDEKQIGTFSLCVCAFDTVHCFIFHFIHALSHDHHNFAQNQKHTHT